MRLNLGCGRVLFPFNAERAAAAHPALATPDTVYEPDWRNVDGLALDGVDEVVDLFAYPWPWDDNSVDEIWASHLCEHIPHATRRSFCTEHIPPNYESEITLRWKEIGNLDGFYAFFAEAYRVLKPDGVIGVVVPHGRSDGALFDPQHTRYILPQTFHYLGNGGGNSPTYDYKLPFNFEATAMGYIWEGVWAEMYRRMDGMPEGQERTELANHLHMAERTYNNVISTLRVHLKAVK